ncbi:MAG: nuclear transport factor 2 family protein [Sphingomicrobium sp.]
MRRTLIGLALGMSTLGGCASALAPPADLAIISPQAVAERLLAADRAFAAAAKGAPLIDAIAAMLADDAVMPAPQIGFATGKPAIVAALSANPANVAATAEWAPVRAGISADGLHGFTYGFMTIREPGKPDRRAKYLSYWVKRADGWRVALYKRAGSAPGDVSTALRAPSLPTRLIAANPADAATHRVTVAATEKAFSDRAQAVGLGAAFVKYGSAGAMNMGGGFDFTFGNTAIGGGFPKESGSPVHWAADQGSLAASSGYLGVTWGFIRPHAPTAGEPTQIPFFTVWHRAEPQSPRRYIAE